MGPSRLWPNETVPAGFPLYFQGKKLVCEKLSASSQDFTNDLIVHEFVQRLVPR